MIAEKGKEAEDAYEGWKECIRERGVEKGRMRILHQEGNQEKTGNRSEWIEWSEKMRNGWKRK